MSTAIQLKQPEHTYKTMNKKGHWEVRNLITDEVLYYQLTPEDLIIDSSDLVEIILEDGSKVLCQKGLEDHALELKSKRWSFCEPMMDRIIDKIVDGGKITKLGEGFPSYSVIWRWRRQFPEFEEALAMAMKMKADKFISMIEEEVEDLDTVAEKIELDSKKAKIDNMKWLAEKHDGNRFGRGKEISSGGAVQIVVNTGIIREEDIIVTKEEDGNRRTEEVVAPSDLESGV